MTSRERILAVLEGRQPDRTPVFPKIAFANVLACENMKVIDYMTDPECMARACITAYRRFGWDGVALHTDIGSEGMALGSIYARPGNAPAELKTPLLSTADEYEAVIVPNPLTTEPMKTVIEAVRLVKAELGEEAYIAAWTNGPLNVASQVLALEEVLIGLLTEPETIHKLLEKCTDVAVAYATELIRAGADCIAYGHATASATVISRESYREFALPYETRLISEIHAHGARAITHICGNIEPIIDLIAQNGSDVVDFDHVCAPAQLRAKLGADKVLRGNLDPTLLALGTPEEITRAIHELRRSMSGDNRFLLGTGCEVSLATPIENFYAMMQACTETL